MRTPEVDAAMSYRDGPLSCVLTMSDGSKRYGHEILAGEVERLEDACSLHEGIIEACETERNAAISRAEAAEARVRELEADIAGMKAFEKSENDLLNEAVKERAELQAQNARLREALEEIAASHDSPDNDRIAKAALAELADRHKEGA